MKGTAEAAPNIALVKYWGKRDEKLILPKESSIAITLDSQFKTKTTVEFSKGIKRDEIWIDKKQVTKYEELEKPIKQLNVIRKIAKTDLKAKVSSITRVPFAGGLAGSSAGLCALALAATTAFGLKLSNRELSIICRIGSGSACRSIYGGFTEWKKGEKEDGSDSYAIQIANEDHWQELRYIIAIIETKEKKIKSRAGMKQTVTTSSLYTKRIQDIPKVLETVRKAIKEKNAPILFETIMRESNNMHATMLDTFPPIIYLNDISKEIIYTIHKINKRETKAGYTFDAGPNPVIFTLSKNVQKIKKELQKIEGVKEIFVGKVGSGPKILKEHLF